jgi:hypothetical protein
VIAVLIGGVNFVWFAAESAQLGGDALNGYVADERYFVASHGTFTEVARGTWEWSRAHAISVFATHPFALLGMAYLAWRLLALIRSNVTP